MEPWQALRMATGYAGELVMMCGPNTPYPDGKLGMVKEGYYADMILVDGDPTEDIKWVLNRENFSLIMKDGVIYKNTVGERADGTPSVVEVDRGVAANWGDPPDESQRQQTTVEASYRLQFAQNLALTVGGQLLKNPALNPGEAEVWLLSLRARATF